MESKSNISINELLSISIQLVSESIKIIYEVQSSKELNESWKGKNDPLTIADIKAQTLILKGLGHHFPNIKYVAEEDEVFPGKLSVDCEKMQKKILPEEIYPDSLRVSQEELTAFIDPLDGTYAFVIGGLSCVTVLLGYAINKRPAIGIMGKIWNQDSEGKFVYEPEIYFGYVPTQKVYCLKSFDILKPESNIPIEIPRPIEKDLSKEFVVVYSKNRMNEYLENNVKKLNYTRAYKAGATGYKCLCIVLGLADCYFYEVEEKGTKRWDTCVGEALLSCFGGILTGKDGKKYDYEYGVDPRNMKGVVAMMNVKKFEEVIKITSQMPYDPNMVNV